MLTNPLPEQEVTGVSRRAPAEAATKGLADAGCRVLKQRAGSVLAGEAGNHGAR